MQSTIKIHEQDNVAVALRDLAAGETVELDGGAFNWRSRWRAGTSLRSARSQGRGHHQIWPADRPRARGHRAREHIHSQNAKTNLSDLDSYRYQPQFPALPPQAADREVQLYRRAGGDVGIRNELWIVPTVGCVNGIARQIQQRFLQQTQAEDRRRASVQPSVRLLAAGTGSCQHPHHAAKHGAPSQRRRGAGDRAGVREQSSGGLRATLGMADERRLRFMVCQQQDDEVEAGLGLLHELYREMRHDRREPGRLSELKFGLECGGSDGLSGITANPLLGRFSDYVIANGGTTVLTEVPEMFGAERILMSRCRDGETFDKTVDMINDFKRYFIAHQQPIYENPSPGNKAGGITTLEEKSLGCTQKAGLSRWWTC